MAAQRILYNTTGNVIMSGTPEYELAALEGKPGYNEALAAYRKRYAPANTAPNKTNLDALRQELEAYSYEDLVKYYHESIDPDGAEDLSGMDEADLIEAILERVQEMSGGKRRHNRKTHKKRSTRRRKIYKRKHRKSRKNRYN